MFLAAEKVKYAKSGKKYEETQVVAVFNKMDADGDGVITGAEKKIYWAK